ncbi:MAG TPA: hypothetical protein DD412_02735, partial [Holosporales bacterium]|nr:hypothetical protein [Holosporales bacterium]
MLNNCKKSMKRISYSFAALLFSAYSLQASFLNAEALEKAKTGLSKASEHLPEVEIPRPNLANIVSAKDLSKADAALSRGSEHLPEVDVQRSNLADIVSEEAIRNFWNKAKKVEAGSSSADQSEGINREHSELFAAIKSHNGLVPKAPLVRKTNWVLVSWGQLLATEISELTGPFRRDQYIGKNLNHLKTEGHSVAKEEEAYEITGDDLVRVGKAMSLAGNRLLYITGLREKTRAIASERNRQKEDLRQHQAKIVPVLEELQSDSEKGLALKLAYAHNYKGGTWDHAILIAYAKDPSISMGELIRMGVMLQSDEILYGIRENIDLVKWMTYWRSYSEDEESRCFLEKLYSIEDPDDEYFKVLSKLLEVQGTNLIEAFNKALKRSLSRQSLKALMAPKNKMLIELKKRLDFGETLAEQLLHPVTQYPHFVMAGASSDITDLSQSTINLGQSGLMDSIVFDASAVPQILESLDRASSSSAPSSKALTYQMKMDSKNTYVYDPETKSYVLATSKTVLPALFFKV